MTKTLQEITTESRDYFAEGFFEKFPRQLFDEE